MSATIFTKLPSRLEWTKARDKAGGEKNMVLLVNIGGLLDKVKQAGSVPAAREKALKNLLAGLQSYAKGSKVKATPDVLATVKSLIAVTESLIKSEGLIDATLADLRKALNLIASRHQEMNTYPVWNQGKLKLLKQNAGTYARLDTICKGLRAHAGKFEGVAKFLGEPMVPVVDGLSAVDVKTVQGNEDELVEAYGKNLRVLKTNLIGAVTALRKAGVSVTAQPDKWLV